MLPKSDGGLPERLGFCLGIPLPLVVYGQLPSYRTMLDREGVAGPADIAIVGDENALRGEIDRFRNAGVTDFNAAIMTVEDGAYDRTLEFLASLK